MKDAIPRAWRKVLEPVTESGTFQRLCEFVDGERRSHAVYPPADVVFRALELVTPGDVRVVLLGQDPYHDEGQAMGLCFSVPTGTRHPPSLRNILRERETDLGIPAAGAPGDLEPWARRGVLLLNTVLTVRAHEAGSHRGHGWESFTDAVVKHLGMPGTPRVFLLWGADAQKRAALVSSDHRVLMTAHPSPLSAHRGFTGSRVFSGCNRALEELGHAPLDWDNR